METRINNIIKFFPNIKTEDNKVVISEERTTEWITPKHNLAECSGTDFATLVFNLIEKANKNFADFQDASVRVKIMDMVEDWYSKEDMLRERVTKAVETMYKRERKREEYITKTMAAQKKMFFDHLPINYDKKEVKYFHIDSSFGLSDDSQFKIMIHKDEDVVRDRIFTLWEQIRHNNIIDQVIGLRFVYTPTDEYGLDVSFPTVEFVFTAEGKEEYKKNQIRLF